jgi:CYTH domain-containing protein
MKDLCYYYCIVMTGNVKYIRNIMIIREESEPDIMAVRANGLARLSALPRPVLVPREYDVEPDDGIMELDFAFVGEAENVIDVEMEVDTVLKIKNLPHWVKGLRINASENSDIELI